MAGVLPDRPESHPVAAYDLLAPEFDAILEKRRLYLEAVEQLVITNIPAGARSMLDIGAGNGRRALRIATEAKVPELTLLEPSPKMRSTWPSSVESWPIRAEQLSERQGCFDVVTCLWNVLGHIFPRAERERVLRQFTRLLSPTGLAFIDVSHRYNLRHYGWLPTILRRAGDLFHRHESLGDVQARWNVGGRELITQGHVFTDTELRQLARAAGLGIVITQSVDYKTGELQNSKYNGHLFYGMRTDVVK